MFFIFLLVILGVILAISPQFVLAQPATPCPAGAPDGSVCLGNPLGNITTPGHLVVKGFAGFAGLMAAIAIAFTVFSGVKLIIATNEEAIKSAREGLAWSVGGFALSLLAYSLIVATGNFLGFDPDLIGRDTLQNPVAIPGGEQASLSFIDVMNFIMTRFLGLVGFVTTLMIIYYGYRYITSAGNEEAIKSAVTGLKWAILGLAVTLLAFTIITVIRQFIVFGPS